MVASEVDGGFVFSSLQTIPGFHWAWTALEPELALFGSAALGNANATALGNVKFSDLTSAPPELVKTNSFSVHYKMNLPQLAESGRWPAVVGSLGLQSGTLGLPAFLRVYPKALNTSVRVYFLNQQRGAAVVESAAPSCGQGCVEFENLAHALDTPLSVSEGANKIVTLGSASDFPYYVSAANEGVFEKFSVANVESARTKARSAWLTLNKRLGKVESKATFQTHVGLRLGCAYQGLEHSQGTLLSFGVGCENTNLEQSFLALAVHEMVHVWNAKLFFPEENASWKPFDFGSERLKKLYFYEGLTEGLSRLLNEELGNSAKAIKTANMQWNSTFYTLALNNVGNGKTVESISVNSPNDGYQVGAYFALKMFAEARVVDGEEAGKMKFWDLFSALSKARDNRPAFDLKKLPWQQLDFESGLTRKTASVRQGYTNDDLVLAVSESMGESMAAKVTGRFLKSTEPLFADAGALNEEIGAIATALGKTVAQNSRGVSYFVSPEP